jgi:hypothetical protein
VFQIRTAKGCVPLTLHHPAGRLTGTTFPDRPSTTVQYDGNGNAILGISSSTSQYNWRRQALTQTDQGGMSPRMCTIWRGS